MSLKQEFFDFHKVNPNVYAVFERFSLEAAESGIKKTSAWLIVNRIRWEVEIKTYGDEYKIQNGYIQYYARLFMKNHPQYFGFFDTKKIKGDLDTWWHPEETHAKVA